MSSGGSDKRPTCFLTSTTRDRVARNASCNDADADADGLRSADGGIDNESNDDGEDDGESEGEGGRGLGLNESMTTGERSRVPMTMG